MAFTKRYLERCWSARRTWRGKRTKVGDWYLEGGPENLRLVGEREEEAVDFSREDIAFVPEVSDLLEMVEKQVGVYGAKWEGVELAIRCTNGHWWVQIEYAGRRTVAAGQESIHSALLYALYQMAAVRMG